MPRLRRIRRRTSHSENTETEHVISSEIASKYDNIPLHSIVKEDNAEKLDYLLGQPNIDLNYRDEVTALYLSLQLLRSDSFIIRLIEAGCDPNLTTVNNDAPLHIAVNRLTTKVALKLIEKGADVNAVDADNRTPLHYAVKNNNLESVCMLLYHGANVNFEDAYWETPFDIALKFESLDIISVLMGYYDSNALLLSLASQQTRTRFSYVKVKLIFYLVNTGANVNCTDRQGNNLLSFSLNESNDKLFKLIWSRLDYAILLEGTMPFLTNYINDCKFPQSQWLECLYLILESPIASDLIKHATKHDTVSYYLAEALNNRKIEPKDRIAIIYLFLSLASHLNDECFKIVYKVYGFHEELEALIYCSSTNLKNYEPEGCSFNFPLIIKPLKEEPSTKDVFEWLKNEIEMFDGYDNYDNRSLVDKIANTLGLFWLPAHMKTMLCNLYLEGRAEVSGDIPRVLNGPVTVPSLRELSRSQTRRYIRQNFKIERAYQFYDVLKKLKLPQVIYDIICFKKHIY